MAVRLPGAQGDAARGVHLPETGTARVARGGCTFCNNAGFSPNVRVDAAGIRDQLARGIEAHRHKARRFIAYFQAYTNTYGPPDYLRSLYDEVWKFSEVSGLSVGTRPDCIDAGVVDLLAGYVDRGEVWVEYGLQSSFDRTLERVNRGHTYGQFLDAIELTRGRGLKICVHTILGLPGEDREMMLETHRRLAALPIDGIKIHLLHIMRDTVMAGEYEAGQVPLLSREEFVERVADVLELLPPNVVIQRMHADAPPDVLVAPLWCLDKSGVLDDIRREQIRRDSWQGKALGFALADLPYAAADRPAPA